MTTKTMDLGQVAGSSAYQEAQAGGYTGTKEEFQKELAGIGSASGNFLIYAVANFSNGMYVISNVSATQAEVQAAWQAGKAIRLVLEASAGAHSEFALLQFIETDGVTNCVFGAARADTTGDVAMFFRGDAVTATFNSARILQLSDDVPAASGTASAGISGDAARADHVHPKEVSGTDRATWNGKASKPTVTTVTLTAAGWDTTTKKQTVTVPGVLADTSKQVIWVTQTTEAAIDAYLEAGIVPVAQAANAVTLRADTVPTADITVNIVVQEVQ